MAGGIQAGASGRTKSVGNLRRNLSNFPFDSSSARTAASPVLRVIFSMYTVAPRAAATRPMAFTSAVERAQEEL